MAARVNHVWKVMKDLLDCLCTQMDECPNPKLCSCTILPGLSDGFIDVAMDGDDCGGGSAWVRLIQVFPSSTLPGAEQGFTDTAFTAVELEVGCARPITSVGEDGEAPTREQQLADAEMLMIDMATMKLAIECCFGAADEPTRDYVLGTYTPWPGMGGAGGGGWRVFVRVN